MHPAAPLSYLLDRWETVLLLDQSENCPTLWICQNNKLLQMQTSFCPGRDKSFPNGAYVAEVEIDRDTGQVRLARYTAVDDSGVLVNPMIAMGQAHGAIAQGVGQALLEHAAYDRASGQLVAGSLMDYALPRADDLPAYELGFNGTRCTTNPLGVKGCGEAGAVGAFPAVTNAILDALAPFGVADITGPATPENIWRAING